MNKFKNLNKREKAEYIAVIALYPLIWLFAQLGKVCKLFNTKKRQITASVLSLAIVLTMLPIMSLTAFAAGATGVTIGNVALDAANPYYHNGTNGTQGTADNNPAGANATFTAAEGNNPAVLTLNNLNLNIASGDGVKITGGEVKIMLTDGTQNNSPKIYCSSKLTITGGGKLNVTTSNDDDYGIYSLGALTITGTTVKVVCSDSTKGISAVYTAGSSMIIEDSKLDATSGKDTGSSNTSNSCGVRSNGEITVKGTSVVTATAKDSANGKSWGMAANGGITIKDTAVVTATAGNSTVSYGIVGQYSVTISGGTVVASGNTGALNRVPNLTDVSALGSTSVDGSGATTYESGKNSTYKWFMSEKLSEAGASDETWSQGSYTAQTNITLNNRITINGTVTLRIPNGVKITANKGFEIAKGSTLIIYGPGELVAYPGDYFTPAFGCTSGSVNQCGDLIIHSGTVTASGDAALSYNIRVNHLTMDDGTLTAWARGCTAIETGSADIADTLKIFANYTGNPAATENAASSIKDNATYDFSNYAVEIRPATLHPDLYAVTLNTNGGTVNSGSLTSYTSGTATTLPDDVSKDGFSFGGWFDNADCAGTAVTEISASATGHKTYYAKWDEKILGTLTSSDFIFTPPTVLTYDGTTKTASVAAKEGVKAGAVTVKYYDANDYLLSDAPKNAGTYTVKIDVAGNDKYNAATDLTDAAWTFTIEQRTLIVTATPYQSKYYGMTDPTFTYANGFAVRGETPAFDGALTRDAGEAVATYAIRQGTLTLKDNGAFKAANYKIAFSFSTDDFSVKEYNPSKVATFSPDGNNNWFKTGTVVLTAPTGFQISTSNALVGNTWSDSITLDGTNGTNKTATYYLKNNETGAVSTSAEADYKVDTVAPTDLKVQYNDNGFKSFLNTITFGIFFKETVNVTATATDELSGIDTNATAYYVSDSEVTDFTNTPWQNSLSLTPNSKKIVYIKVTDKAGNVTITNNEGVVVYSDSTVSPETSTFDKKTDKQADIDFTMTLNDNTLKDIKNGTATLVKDTDYTVNGSIVTVKKAYFAAQANGNVTLTFSFHPMGVENNDNLSTATVTVTVSDSTHRHSMEYTAAVAATCTMDGNSEYWYCTGCGKYFSNENGNTEIALNDTVLTALDHDFTEKKVDAAHLKSAANCISPAVYYYDCSRCDEISTTDTFTDGTALGHDFTGEYDGYDDTYHWHICNRDNCEETDTKAPHSGGTATYFEQATCAVCGQKYGNTTADITAPTGEITIASNHWNTFLNTVTFGLFFKETKTVAIIANDTESGIAKIEYLLSDTVFDTETAATGTWHDITAEKRFDLNGKSKQYIYVRLTDADSNVAIINSEGVVIYTDSTVSPTTATFDKNTVNQADVTIEMTLNGNTLKDIKNGNSILTSGMDYTVNGNTVTVKKAYFAAQPNGNVTLTFSFYPMGVENDTNLSAATATITISDSTHRHSMDHTAAVAATCTMDGNSEYWHCAGCGNYFSNENGTNAITLASTVLTKLGHSFTNYVYNNNATYEKDGTETAKCDRCDETDTRTKSGTKLVDTTAPTGEIKISTNSFKDFVNSITFGLFFKDSQTVSIIGADDGIGMDKIYYFKSETALSLDEVKALSADKWTEGASLTLSPDWQGVVYAKITDKSGNALYISSDGLVLDATAPVIAGVTDGGKYCNTATVQITVTEINLNTVKLDGEAVTLDRDGTFTVSTKDGAQKIVVTDKAGNETTATITVYAGHAWDEGKVTTEPTTEKKGVKTYTCSVCGETKTEEIPMLPPSITEGGNASYTEGGKDGLTFKSNAALSDLESVSVDGKVIDKVNYTTKEGSTVVTLNAEYLATLSVGKHTLDINSTTGTASTEFTIAAKAADPVKPGDSTKPDDTQSPQTGDSSNMVLWLALLLVSGGALSTIGVTKKRKKQAPEK